MRGLHFRPARVGQRASKKDVLGANPAIAATICGLGLIGCLERPVVPSKPNTTNLFVSRIDVEAIEAIDLLFVIDNSISMADKQALLRDAVPLMVTRLITPDCVSIDGDRRASDGQDCESYGTDFFPEFQPVDDIHLGVITSSLGGFGSKLCNDPVNSPDELDKARLMPKVRDVVEATGESVPDPTGLGFLSWTGAEDLASASSALERDLALHVAAAGESGCGFEAPLEAWYRFLVDPEPPLDIELTDGKYATSTGVDTAILEQRSEFLREGSLLLIVVLTDENDCSVMEGGSYYPYAPSGFLLPTLSHPFSVASAACADNPNDPCCHSCALAAPEGCEDTCERPDAPTLPPEADRSGVRCFDGKRRFGVDLLYPTSRYVDALTKTQIVNSRSGQMVENPLLAGRRPDLVFFAGIVGVPWQDVATPESLADPELLEYLPARQLARVDEALGASRYDLLLGRPGLPLDSPECRAREGAAPNPECGRAPTPPLDPFLIESITPRSGVHPLTGDAIVPGGSADWSPINGHEYDNSLPSPSLPDDFPANDDLQYSCIFPLAGDAIKQDCAPGDHSCDCGDEPSRERPLCKPTPSAAAPADRTQRYGKAYPPSRILRVLQGAGENSIVASICPKVSDRNSPSFGYNPAVHAIVDRLVSKLGGQCLPRSLTVSTDGQVPCSLLEATPEKRTCDPAERRAVLTDSARMTVDRRMADSDLCKLEASDVRPLPLCSEFTVCQLLEVDAAGKADCFGSTLPESQDPGYCYIDPASGPSAGGLPSGPGTCLEEDESTWGGCRNPHVGSCDPTERRMLRFVGERTPLPGSFTFVACAGDAADEDAPLPPLQRDED